MSLKIITYFDRERYALLKEISKPIEFPLGEAEKEAIDESKRILTEDLNAFAVAAVQLGVPKRLFVMMYKNKPMVCINPNILWKSTDKKNDTEGCLSFPGHTARIARARELRLEYFDENGQRQVKEFHGIHARVIQHEHDHLNGDLIFDIR